MKKIIALLSLFVLIVAAMSCENENVKKLKNDILLANKQCPVNMGMVGDLMSMKYDENTNEVSFYYVINDDIISIDALKSSRGAALNTMKLSISSEESKPLVKTMIDAGASFLVTFKSAETGKTFEIKLSPEDLKKIYDSPLSTNEKNKLILENQIAMENSTYPILVEEGMEMIKVEDAGDNVIYHCRVDEDLYDLYLLKLNENEVKRNMEEVFEDPLTNKQIKLLSSLGKGLVYHYYGDTSGKSVDITFTPDELITYIK